MTVKARTYSVVAAGVLFLVALYVAVVMEVTK